MIFCKVFQVYAQLINERVIIIIIHMSQHKFKI